MAIGVDVRCATHGQMHYRDALCWWDCIGFDGEGCPARLTDEEVYTIYQHKPIDTTNKAWRSYLNEVTCTLHIEVIV